MEKNNNERLISKKGEFQIYNRAESAHQYTQEEFKSLNKINAMIIKMRIKDNNITKYNNDNTKYYITDNGEVYKLNTENFNSYKLDINSMQWNQNEELLDYIDKRNIRIQELSLFEDYFPINNNYTKEENGRYPTR